MAHRKYHTQPRPLAGDTGSDVTVKLEPVPQGEELHVTRVTVHNDTTGNTYCQLIRRKDGKSFYIDTLHSIPIDTPLAWEGADCVLLPEEELWLILKDTVDGDVINVVVEGYKWSRSTR